MTKSLLPLTRFIIGVLMLKPLQGGGLAVTGLPEHHPKVCKKLCRSCMFWALCMAVGAVFLRFLLGGFMELYLYKNYTFNLQL